MSNLVPLSIAKQQLGSLVDLAHHAHETVFLTRHGKRVAAIVNADEYMALLERLEDFEDAQQAVEAQHAIATSQESLVPWDEVKAELGLS